VKPCSLDVVFSIAMRPVAIGALVLVLARGTASAQDVPDEAVKPADATESGEAGGPDDSDDAASLESQFANYLHFALVGRFDVADRVYGEPLISRPELNPLTDEAATALVALSEKHEDSIETLLLIINNSTIGDNAKKMLALIRKAHKRKRMNPSRIKSNIRLLTGSPMQRAVGLERLIESGEYAVPWMLGTVADPGQEQLRPFVLQALPQLGRSAVNPLLAALGVEDEPTLHCVIDALGKIGYQQALPYLQRLATDDKVGASVRESAAAAIAGIEADDPAAKEKPATELFHDLAEHYYYYANADSLRPDPREDSANVWNVRKDALAGEDPVEPVAVPRDIYNLVMCMRCSQESLRLNPDQPGVVALWLAANFRREARLGLDVQSEETVEARALDPSRPEIFPRSIYFARSAGPTCCQIALSRAIKDRDREVALGAIAALNVTAGPRALVDPQDPGGTSLARALFFPDLLVRLKAALALGRAMPKTAFQGSGEVVPVLASALAPTDKNFYLVVDPDESSRQQLEAGLQRTGAVVVAADRLTPALRRAHQELTHLDGVFLADDMERPTPIEAIRELARDDRFALAPIVILLKGDTLILDRVNAVDDRVGGELLDLAADGSVVVDSGLVDRLLEKKDRVAGKFGHRALSPEMRLSLALEAAQTLQAIAASDSQVLDVTVAEKTLIDALTTHESEELRVAAAAALSWLDSESAQQAIAVVALGVDETESLRMPAFASLAGAARRFGSHLDERMTDRLIKQAFDEPNLALRTAASQALGALNLPERRAADIIVGQAKE